MSGKPITKEKVKLYMSYRAKYNQITSAAIAGISELTARRIEFGHHSTHKQPRHYRTRKDPFNGTLEKYLVPMLEKDSQLQPITLLGYLDEVELEKYGATNCDLFKVVLKNGLRLKGQKKQSSSGTENVIIRFTFLERCLCLYTERTSFLIAYFL